MTLFAARLPRFAKRIGASTEQSWMPAIDPAAAAPGLTTAWA
jgi:hypothetical protein